MFRLFWTALNEGNRLYFLVETLNILVGIPLLYLFMVKTSGPPLMTYHQMFPWLF